VVVLLAFQSGCSDCNSSETVAQVLRESYEACSPGDACMVVHLGELTQGDWGSSCIPAFQCAAAFRVGSDLEVFRRLAEQIITERNCEVCYSASCAGPEQPPNPRCVPDPTAPGKHHCVADGL
jgi:hypothetical protein